MKPLEKIVFRTQSRLWGLLPWGLFSLVGLVMLAGESEAGARILGSVILVGSVVVLVRTSRAGITVYPPTIVVRSDFFTKTVPIVDVERVDKRDVLFGVYEQLELELLSGKTILCNTITQVARRRDQPGPVDHIVDKLREVIISRNDPSGARNYHL